MPIFTEHREKLLMLPSSLLLIVKGVFTFLRGAFTSLMNITIPKSVKCFAIL